jgi:putative DNA primase/helicase
MEINDKNDNTMLERALAYAAEGWLVVPLYSTVGERCTCEKKSCGSRGKHPRTQHGVKDATRDPAQITEWWTRWPDANIGLATGKVSKRIVLDVDIKNGKRGDESLRLLEKQYGPLPKTLKSVTASGGWHYVFRMPDYPVKSRNGVREGLDLLSDGKYFVAPPSKIDGVAYCWTEVCDA